MKAIVKGMATVLLASVALLMTAAHAGNWIAIGVYPESVGSTLKGQTVYLDLDRIAKQGDFTIFSIKSKRNPGLISFFSYPEIIEQIVVNCSDKTFSSVSLIGVKDDGEQVLVKETPEAEIVFKDVGTNSIIENHWARFCSPKSAPRTHAENWISFGVSGGAVPGTKGQSLYLDINAIERTGVFTRIWLKTDFVSVTADNIVTTIQRLIVNCDNNTFGIEKVVGVKSNEERISIKDIVPKLEEFRAVDATFLEDNRWNLICPARVASAAPATRSGPEQNKATAPPKSNESLEPKYSFSSGSGFFVTEDGYFVTNYHVVEGAEAIVLSDINAKQYDAVVVRVDKANDIAVLKTEGKFKAIPIASSRTVKRGQDVVTVGYPHVDIQGVEPKVTGGIINSLSGLGNDARTFQVSVPLQSGNSGGPLVTMEGNVVGVVTMKLSALVMLKETGDLPQNVNYAIKSNYLTEVLLGIPGVERKLIAPSSKAFKSVAELTSAIESATALVVAAGNEEKQ